MNIKYLHNPLADTPEKRVRDLEQWDAHLLRGAISKLISMLSGFYLFLFGYALFYEVKPASWAWVLFWIAAPSFVWFTLNCIRSKGEALAILHFLKLIEDRKHYILQRFEFVLGIRHYTKTPCWPFVTGLDTYHYCIEKNHPPVDGDAKPCIFLISTSTKRDTFESKTFTLEEVADDYLQKKGRFPRHLFKLLAPNIMGQHLSRLSLAGSKCEDLVNLMLAGQPKAIECLPEYNEKVMRLWAKHHLKAEMKSVKPGKDFIETLAKALKNVNTGIYIPSVLIVKLADFCTSNEGKAYLEGFSRWFYLAFRQMDLGIKNPAEENWWMLSDVYSQQDRIRKTFGSTMHTPNAFEHAVKKIIDCVGVHINAQQIDECKLGYQKLFGSEAAMRQFPDSGRLFLSKDLCL